MYKYSQIHNKPNQNEYTKWKLFETLKHTVYSVKPCEYV